MLSAADSSDVFPPGTRYAAAKVADITKKAALKKAILHPKTGDIQPPIKRPKRPPATVADTYDPITTLSFSKGSFFAR